MECEKDIGSIFILLDMIYISINPILVRAEGHEEEAGG